jgi:hypothetical protein
MELKLELEKFSDKEIFVEYCLHYGMYIGSLSDYYIEKLEDPKIEFSLSTRLSWKICFNLKKELIKRDSIKYSEICSSAEKEIDTNIEGLLHRKDIDTVLDEIKKIFIP